MKFQKNPWLGKGLPDNTGLADGDISSATDQAKGLYGRCPEARATDLRSADVLAAKIGVGSLHIKDERSRMGLGSFKALGAAYAVAKKADEKVKNGAASGYKTALEGLTFVCASAGNHGLSLAAGAPQFGAKAVVFVSETVPEPFAERLRRLGADVIRAGDNYEASMAEALRQADENGWQLLPDSTWPGMIEPGRDVMEGYLVMGDEVANQIPKAPTHVFLQAGVGGLAAACSISARMAWGPDVKIIIVEPDAAPALWASIEAGKLAVGDGPVSNMGRLDCKEPSHLALRYLAKEADAFVLVTDAEATATVDLLKSHDLATTPSGAAGISAVHHADASLAELGLGPQSRVLCYLSEGPEDV
ncbi:MAG: pyridoxal-phosphate dependent enzyme [Roseibium sp.]